MPLTPADVRNKQFSTTRLRPGYDEEEVDAFLDEVEVELDRLIQENEELRSKLAECLRGGKTAVSALSSPLADPEPEMLAPEPTLHMCRLGWGRQWTRRDNGNLGCRQLHDFLTYERDVGVVLYRHGEILGKLCAVHR